MSRPRRQREAAPEAANKGSRGSAARIEAIRAAFRSSERAALAVLVAGAVAGLLMIATEFAPVATVTLQENSCQVAAEPQNRDRCALSGFERHGGALLLLGLAALATAYGAGPGASRPAAAALLAIGAVVLALTLLRDLPETTRTGFVGTAFEGAKSHKGTGFWLELGAGALAIATGAAGLTRPGTRAPVRT